MNAPSDIPGPPSLLAIDASADAEGWEADLAVRICDAMRRQRVPVSGPHPIAGEEQVAGLLAAAPEANCLFIMAHWQVEGANGPALSALWRWLSERAAPASKLVAVYACGQTAPLDQAELLGPRSFAAAAVVSRPGMTQREAHLLVPAFFAELTTHCQDSISSAMIRFCFAKAKRFAPANVELWMRPPDPHRAGD